MAVRNFKDLSDEGFQLKSFELHLIRANVILPYNNFLLNYSLLLNDALGRDILVIFFLVTLLQVILPSI